MNIELNPASSAPVSDPAKSADQVVLGNSSFLDALLKIAQQSIPVEATGTSAQQATDTFEVEITALFDRSSGFFNFANAISYGPHLNFLDVVFPDSPSIDLSTALPSDRTAGNPKGIPFIDIFGI